MVVFKPVISCYLLCFICFKGIKAAKLYLIDILGKEDEFLQRYDDYDEPVNMDYNYVNDQNNKPNQNAPYTQALGNEIDYNNKAKSMQKKPKIKTNEHKLKTNGPTFPLVEEHPEDAIATCHRLFGSLYSNKKRLRLCFESLHNKNTVRIPREKKSTYEDEKQFSQDYWDLADDLARSQFAEDYIDIGDMRETTAKKKCKFGKSGKVSICIPLTRKTIAKNSQDIVGVEEITNSTDSAERYLREIYKLKQEIASSSDSEEKQITKYKPNKKIASSSDNLEIQRYKYIQKKEIRNSSESNEINLRNKHRHKKDITISSDQPRKKKYKPKRYQVVSAKKWENSYSSEDTDNLGSQHSESDHYFLDSSDSDNSLELTTRKPYKNKLKSLGNDDKFVYLQGNNYYPIGSFRRARLPHFLPKRYHWRENQYKNLGYFWFNGPKGLRVPRLF